MDQKFLMGLYLEQAGYELCETDRLEECLQVELLVELLVGFTV